MATVYYGTLFIASLLLTLLYAMMWHKHFSVHFTLIFCLIPITNLGYLLLTDAGDADAALIANKVIYVGGCFLQPIIMLCVFDLCHVKYTRWLRAAVFGLSSVIFLSMISAGHSALFYRSYEFVQQNGVGMLRKEYGPMHTVFVVTIVLYAVMSIAALAYAYFRKKDVSRRTIYLLLLTELLSVASYFARHLVEPWEISPAVYAAAQIVFLVIIRRVCLYDITDTGIDTLVQTGATGFISFDFKGRYLGSNETAKHILPELSALTVDRRAEDSAVMRETALRWLADFRADEKNDKVYYTRDGSTYLVSVTYLYNGHRRRGYQFFLTDDTKNQQYISLINQYNTDLREEVAEKTAHIVEMHDRLILSMAAMVESRDNSTGGHIRRTSEGVRILTEEMQKDGALGLTEDFCRDLIKAAPMHDLGKIAVDDAVLRKPGRFTPEEFEKMKAHAAEGARIVHDILEGTDDHDFRRIAENVAHYHHERWDGSGYPEHLAGEQIPLEARIMAIADVYDALVSKRVYKDSMSFAQADKIITEGMGTQFDKALEPYYIAARPRLEAYYRTVQAEGGC
ncbi:MAG: HD domain-containing protein [Oscillospiraceae bacterium]|nr:HD domain-containing protein [Oscillospiraceae bacterium]